MIKEKIKLESIDILFETKHIRSLGYSKLDDLDSLYSDIKRRYFIEKDKR